MINMLYRKRFYTTLAIIGNGFDINHNYNTRFSDFSSCVKDVNLDYFKLICEEEESIKTWYDFETNINILTANAFKDRVAENNININKNEKLEAVFREIHRLLINYLKQETTHESTKKPSIENYLNEDAIAINFNYTDTVEKYTKNVIYIHGSLKEQDIILGYDYRNEPCLANFKEMHWGKRFCREKLEFRRFVKRYLHCFQNDKRFNELVENLEIYYTLENSGRGIDDEIGNNNVKHYKLIKCILERIRKHSIPNINYKKIKRIVVIGHGIEADRILLKKIISKCTNLNEIIVFRYDNEKEDSIISKKNFLKQFCENIILESY